MTVSEQVNQLLTEYLVRREELAAAARVSLSTITNAQKGVRLSCESRRKLLEAVIALKKKAPKQILAAN